MPYRSQVLGTSSNESTMEIPTRHLEPTLDLDVPWESIKSDIRKMFLIEKKKVDTIVESLVSRGWNVKKKTLEYHLRIWGFRHKLKPKERKYISYTIKKREKEGKDSVVVHSVSGVQIAPDEIEKKIKRDDRPKFQPSPSPELSGDDPAYYVCTPGSVISYEEQRLPWPKNLPWCDFIAKSSNSLLQVVGLLPRRGARSQQIQSFPTLASLLRLNLPLAKMDAIYDGISHLALRTMTIGLGSKELAISLVAGNSPHRIATQLNRLIPELEPEDNLRRAVALLSCNKTEIYAEVLNVLVFLLSNNMLLLPGEEVWCYIESDLEDDQAVLKLCRLIGLTNPLAISDLAVLAQRDATLLAFLQKLLSAAWRTRSTDVLDALEVCASVLSLGSMHPGDFSFSIRLEDAMRSGNVELVESLLLNSHSRLYDRPCVYNNSYRGQTWLEIAIIIQPHDTASRLAELLLKKGLTTNPADQCQDEFSPLDAAVVNGNMAIVQLLVKFGANIHHTNKQKYLRVHPKWGGFTCLDLAASYGNVGAFPLNRKFVKACMGEARSNDRVNPEIISKKMVEYFLSLDQGEGFSVSEISYALRCAAAVGYKDVISLLYQNGADINAPDMLIKPLAAALNNKQYETCRLLLNLGADPTPRNAEKFEVQAPSILHIAAWYRDSYELAEYLIKSGADVRCESLIHGDIDKLVDEQQSRQRWEEPLALESLIYWNGRGGLDKMLLTPLDVAIARKSWDVASLFLRHGAAPAPNHLNRAAGRGGRDLVGEILRIHPKMISGDGVVALHNALKGGYEAIAIDLLNAGIIATGEDLIVAVDQNLGQAVGIIMDKGFQVTEDIIASAFRSADASVIEKLLPKSPRAMGWTKEGRSCLEMALRGGRSDLVNFAFNLDSLYYDSAALCAAVVSITKQKSQITSQFQQLMRRRELMLESEHPRVVPQLEITALSIALFYQRADLLTLIHRAEFAKVASVLSTSTQALIDMVNFQPPHRKAYIMDLESKLDKCLSRSAAWESSSPIYWALLGNFLEIIPKLLESGYQSDAMTLCLAIRHKLPSSVLELLVAACDNIDSHHSFVPTALQFAVQHGSLELVKMLLQRGANPNATPVEGKRLASADALALAIERGEVQLVAILISAGANINQPPSQNQGIAALQAAAIFGQIEILRSLLSNRAEINARRAYFDGRTALEGAAENGRLDTVQLLLDYGVDTDQKGRVQYIRATVFAHRMGYAAVERVLRAHRSWTEKDENIWDDVLNSVIYSLGSRTTFFHPEECSENEVTEFLQVTYPWGKTSHSTSLIEESTEHVVCLLCKYHFYPEKQHLIPEAWLGAIAEWRSKSIESTDSEDDHRQDLRGESNDKSESDIPSEGHISDKDTQIQQGASNAALPVAGTLPRRVDANGVDSLDAWNDFFVRSFTDDNFFVPSFQDDDFFISSFQGGRFETRHQKDEARVVEVEDVEASTAEGEEMTSSEQRRRAFLDDMLGGHEAPFIPLEWQL